MPGLVVHEAATRADMDGLYRRADMLLYANPGPRSMAKSIYLTALQAQDAGCIPVTTPHVAIDKEMYGGLQVPLEEICDTVFYLNDHSAEKELIRSNMRKLHIPTWGEVAKKWERLLE
jgi:glycosyltransferase involved in cell wall biosynthesis